MVSNPEFLREGSAIEDTLRPDRIVIGAPTQQVAMTLVELYAPLERPMIITDLPSAEVIKYASNAFLAAKISFINAIGNICEAAGADVSQVMKGMGLDSRIGLAFLQPGLGYGGSCFPKDVDSLIHTAAQLGYDFKLLRSVVEINKERASHLVGMMEKALGPMDETTVAVLGLAFKPNTDDMREAKSLEVIRLLHAAGDTHPRLRSRRHGQCAAAGPPRRRLQSLRLRGGRRGGRHRAAHGMERVQVPQPGAAPRPPETAGDLRRPQSLRAGAHATSRLRVLLHRAKAHPAGLERSDMRVLVTGGAGFIGSHLCDFLLAHGSEVVCMDSLLTGSLDNIAHIRDPRFLFVKHDVTNFIVVDGPLDYVLHFASPASPIDYLELPIQTLKVGALGTHKALGLAKARGARFLLASTSEVYGDPLVHPQREDYWGNVNPVGPRGVYDEAKRFAEAMTMAYHRVHGVDSRIVRIFNTYGPRMRLMDGRAIPTFVRQALAGEPLTVYGDGSQTRSFTYIADLVDGIWKLMHAPVNDPVNIGNPREMTLLELAKQILRLSGSKSEITFRPLPTDDPKVRQPDIARARRLLGWEPTVDVEDGLRRTIEWYRATGATR